MLIGGPRNIDPETEMTEKFGSNSKITEYLLQFIEHKIGIKHIKLDSQWSGIIATGKSKLPIVKSISDELYVAVRLGSMGVAMGSAVAKELVDLMEYN